MAPNGDSCSFPIYSQICQPSKWTTKPNEADSLHEGPEATKVKDGRGRFQVATALFQGQL